MPKLDPTRIIDRIEKQLQKLRSGGAMVIRDIEAVLNDEQISAARAAWMAQKQFHRGTRTQDSDKRMAMGMKGKREVYIDALAGALTDAKAGIKDHLQKAQATAAGRQIEIYTNAMANAKSDGMEVEAARNFANNELTRAGLGRLDRRRREACDEVRWRSIVARTQKVEEVEGNLRARIRDGLTNEELEQEKMLERHQKWKAG